MLEKKIIITTSWDDGFDLDLRISELLEKYNMKGTFYIPIRNAEHSVMSATTLNVLSTYNEIGGHTVNHIYLNTLGKVDAQYEISGCKAILEQKLGKKVDAFCFPGGKFSLRDIHLLQESGFLFGRTTRLLHTSLNEHPILLDTSVQVYNHRSVKLTAHCLKNAFLLPILQYLFFYKENKNFFKLADVLINRIMITGGIFHLWGHSWEIEQYGLWNEFEMVLKMLAFHQEAIYLNNTDCWKIMKTSGA